MAVYCAALMNCWVKGRVKADQLLPPERRLEREQDQNEVAAGFRNLLGMGG